MGVQHSSLAGLGGDPSQSQSHGASFHALLANAGGEVSRSRGGDLSRDSTEASPSTLITFTADTVNMYLAKQSGPHRDELLKR